ncbi:MAG: helix-turn-helix domain-containing protein [Acholeplasmatales bacterium]|jgi:transcriptional regulator with XRE-family HTH domain|nr:helix-turn-helix domain-containing protein [Acholeplasmatales bacterium]
MTTGEKIYTLRRKINLTQEQLADILQVSRQSISRWETNLSYPETEKLIKLSELFQVTVDYLLKDNAKEPQTKVKKELLSRFKLSSLIIHIISIYLLIVVIGVSYIFRNELVTILVFLFGFGASVIAYIIARNRYIEAFENIIDRDLVYRSTKFTYYIVTMSLFAVLPLVVFVDSKYYNGGIMDIKYYLAYFVIWAINGFIFSKLIETFQNIYLKKVSVADAFEEIGRNLSLFVVLTGASIGFQYGVTYDFYLKIFFLYILIYGISLIEYSDKHLSKTFFVLSLLFLLASSILIDTYNYIALGLLLLHVVLNLLSYLFSKNKNDKRRFYTNISLSFVSLVLLSEVIFIGEDLELIFFITLIPLSVIIYSVLSVIYLNFKKANDKNVIKK